MVFLEEAGKKRQPAATRSFLKKRGALWRSLDEQLTTLGQSDSQGFSELMMDQDVVLEDVNADELKVVIQAAEGVIRSLQRETKQEQQNQDVAGGLQFELTEMKALLKRLKGRRTSSK